MPSNAAQQVINKIPPATHGEWATTFANPGFYMELLSTGLALALAWLIAVLIRRQVKGYFDRYPLKRVDVSLILRPLSLLAPILALVFLALLVPLVEAYSSGDLLDAAMKLSMGYLVARGVMYVVYSRPVAYFIATVVMIVSILRASGYMRSSLDYLRAVTFEVGTIKISMLGLVHGIVILVVVFWLAGAASRTLEQHLRKSAAINYNTRELIAKFFRVFVYFVAFMVTLASMGVDLTAFAVFGGAMGVGLGLGLQKITANFVSGITLLMEKSIKIGDLIEVGGNTGWVRQLNIRYALLETADGRELLIPNEELLSTRVTNWTYSNEQARLEVKVTVDYAADAKLAQKLMLEAAGTNPRCLKTPEPMCFLREFGDHGLVFTLNFWIANVRDGRMAPQSDVMFSILEKFRQAGIVIPKVG